MDTPSMFELHTQAKTLCASRNRIKRVTALGNAGF